MLGGFYKQAGNYNQCIAGEIDIKHVQLDCHYYKRRNESTDSEKGVPES